MNRRHDKNKHGGGVIRSRIDSRDYRAEDIFHAERYAGSSNSIYGQKPVDSEFFTFDSDHGGAQLKLGGNIVYNQGSTFKCVAYVCATIREKQVYDEIMGKFGTAGELLNPHRLYTPSTNSVNNGGGMSSLDWPKPGVPNIKFSKNYIYDHRANINSDGMSGADGMEILSRYGCILEDAENIYKQLYDKILEVSRKHQLSSTIEQQNYWNSMINSIQEEIKTLQYRIKSSSSPQQAHHAQDVYASVKTVGGLKESLVNNGPALIILPFYGSNGYSDDNDNNNKGSVKPFWLPPDNNSVDEMGHAVTVVGYSDIQQAFYLRNTWGPEWNECGHFWFPYSSFGLAWETWTLFRRGTEHLTYHKKMAGAMLLKKQQQQSQSSISMPMSNTMMSSSNHFINNNHHHPHDIIPFLNMRNINDSHHLAGAGAGTGVGNGNPNNKTDNDYKKIKKEKLKNAIEIMKQIESSLSKETREKLRLLMWKMVT